MQEAAVSLVEVSRRFGTKVALCDISLDVPRGAVFGLVGENGAGKTTLIKHVLGLLRAQRGGVRVFGLNPIADPVGVLSRIGYLSEENDLPGWMRVNELLRYSRAFYPNWDDGYAQELRNTFLLDGSARIRDLSKGQRAQLGLLGALAHRPELLVLDEPSSGLDPIVRRDILGAVLRTIVQEGRTVLFSSHLLDEVEGVSDHIAMMKRGRILFSAPLADIKRSYHRLTLRFSVEQTNPPRLTGALLCEGTGRVWKAVCRGELAAFQEQASVLGAEIVDEQRASLNDIFMAQSTDTSRAGMQE